MSQVTGHMPGMLASYGSIMEGAFHDQVRQVASVIASHIGNVYEGGKSERKEAALVATMSEHVRRSFDHWESGRAYEALRELKWAMEKAERV